MHETIIALARSISGARDTEASLLDLLCTAQEQTWSERLREGVGQEDCRDAFCCACAFSAVAGLLTGRSGGEGVASFKAGEISLRKCSEAEARTAADGLLRQAEQLMAPYVSEDRFCFRGVRV